MFSPELVERYERARALLPGLEVVVHAHRYQRHGRTWWMHVSVSWYKEFRRVEYADSTDAFHGPESVFNPRFVDEAICNLLKWDQQEMRDIAASP